MRFKEAIERKQSMNKKIIASALTVLLALPAVGLAFTPPSQPSVTSTLDVNEVIEIVLAIFWSIVIAFVIISFILAGFIFITAQGDPAKIAQARQAVIWGIVGVAVILLSYAMVISSRINSCSTKE